jgi:hypothetical protein
MTVKAECRTRKYDMIKRYEIKRVANITAPDGTNPVFYEIWDVIDVEGEERLHRNADVAFDTEAKAQAWVDKQQK